MILVDADILVDAPHDLGQRGRFGAGPRTSRLDPHGEDHERSAKSPSVRHGVCGSIVDPAAGGYRVINSCAKRITRGRHPTAPTTRAAYSRAFRRRRNGIAIAARTPSTPGIMP